MFLMLLIKPRETSIPMLSNMGWMSPTVPWLTWSCFSYTLDFRIHVKVQMILQTVLRPTCVILSPVVMPMMILYASCHPSKHVRHPCPCFSNIGLDVSHASMVAMINACHVFHQNIRLNHGPSLSLDLVSLMFHGTHSTLIPEAKIVCTISSSCAKLSWSILILSYIDWFYLWWFNLSSIYWLILLLMSPIKTCETSMPMLSNMGWMPHMFPWLPWALTCCHESEATSSNM
jgi:hypothetical protein